MRLRDGARRSEGVVVVVVVDDGMLAMTVARIVSGDTPRVAGEQPVIERRDTAATAPTRGSERVFMPHAKADARPATRETTSVCRVIC